MDRRLPLGVGQVLERGEEAGGVGEQVRRTAALVHGGRAIQERLDVDAGERGGKQADGGEHAEAATNAGRHRQRGNALLVGDAAEHAVFRVGREDEVPAVGVVAERCAAARGRPCTAPSSRRSRRTC
jgi:hypothetical protein